MKSTQAAYSTIGMTNITIDLVYLLFQSCVLLTFQAYFFSNDVLTEIFGGLFPFSFCLVTNFSKCWSKVEALTETKKFNRTLTIYLFLANMFKTHVFACRKNHGTDTALLSLTEKWRKELDERNITGTVSIALFVSMDKATEQIHDYLTNRRQRVRLGDQLSNWNEISAGVPQGSVLGPLIFNIFMNNFVYAVKQSTLSAYADDIKIFFAGSTAEKVEEVINVDLANVDKWYEQNGMKRNASKYQAIGMGKSQVYNHISTAKTLLFALLEIWKCLVLS